jgi:hypothetical protein
LDRIPDITTWNAVNHGYCDRLRKEARVFGKNLTNFINQNYNPDSRVYNIAIMSVTTSMAWIFNLISFVKETYNDLVQQSTFSDKKAWALVTQLVRRIFEEVGESRLGITQQLEVEDSQALTQLMFWPIIKSHDVMKRYLDCSFKDDPTISSEYVKFLAAHSGSESSESLKSSVEELVSGMKDINKLVKGASTAAASASNKVDEHKKGNGRSNKACLTVREVG